MANDGISINTKKESQRLILFVFAYHNDREYDRFQYILDHWDRLVDMQTPFRFLFVKSINRELRTAFSYDHLDHQDPPDLKKFQQVSSEWAMVARFIEGRMDCDQWFWWESDVLPVRKDCFDFLLKKWTRSCQIMGYRVKDNKWGMQNCMNGVAFYSRDYWSCVKPYYSLFGTFDTRRPFRDDEQELFVDISPWYALTHHEGKLLLTTSLRLVHGIRDDSLISQMLTGSGPYPVVSSLRRKIRNRFNLWRLERRGYHNHPPES